MNGAYALILFRYGDLNYRTEGEGAIEIWIETAAKNLVIFDAFQSTGRRIFLIA